MNYDFQKGLVTNMHVFPNFLFLIDNSCRRSFWYLLDDCVWENYKELV